MCVCAIYVSIADRKCTILAYACAAAHGSSVSELEVSKVLSVLCVLFVYQWEVCGPSV